jgi:acetyl-CoA carboxylase alpha subunit
MTTGNPKATGTSAADAASRPLGPQPRRQMTKGMTLAELLSLPLMINVSTAARALGLAGLPATNSLGAASSRAACCTSAAPTASLPRNCFASSESTSVSYRRGFQLPKDNPRMENFG